MYIINYLLKMSKDIVKYFCVTYIFFLINSKAYRNFF